MSQCMKNRSQIDALIAGMDVGVRILEFALCVRASVCACFHLPVATLTDGERTGVTGLGPRGADEKAINRARLCDERKTAHWSLHA
jgi:hypothetical protein